MTCPAWEPDGSWGLGGGQDPQLAKRPERASAGRAEGHGSGLHKAGGTTHGLQTPGQRLEQPRRAEYPTSRRSQWQS